MLDLETMGPVPGCVLASAGACKFRKAGIIATFYRRIDLQSCLDLGMHMDADTVLWWMGNSDEARKEIQQPGIPIRQFLDEFAAWARTTSSGTTEEYELWGNGSDFDNALLATAYDFTGQRPPWPYVNNRCYRTVKNLHRDIPPPARPGTKHNALMDASHQARHLMAMLSEL